MSPKSHNTKPVQMRRRLANMSLRLKLYIGVGTLITGLLLVSGITAYTGVTTQQLVRRTLIRQSQLTNLTTNVNNNLLNIQNQAFEFYNIWTRTGFELDVDPGRFDYARKFYLDPLQEQLGQIRSDIIAIQQLEPDLETYADLEKILASIHSYESSLLDMSDQMESLGYRDSGELGQLQQIITELQNRLQETSLEALKTNLAQMDQYAKSFFLRSELIYIRLVRESTQESHKQIAATDETQLSPLDKAKLDEMLEDYYDHILVAANLHSKLHENRGNLVSQSNLVGTLVQRLLEQQRADFSASIEQFRRQQSRTAITTVGLALFILLSGTVIAYFVTNQIIQPIQALGRAAERLGAGELNVRASIPGRDEIGKTATAFDLMADRLERLLAEMEQRVADRTRDLAARSSELQEVNLQLELTARHSQRRAALLHASAEVSRAVTQIRDLDELLPQVTQLISHHFGYYHSGIFLIDRPSGYAVLRAANSSGGQQMLARHHKLRIGSEGIVGFVTETGQPRIAHDVGIDAAHLKTPELPDTRSEMALPLHIGDDIIGALDVQSTKETAFEKEDVAVLTGLADQITIAIQNINLFQQTQAALAEAEDIQRRYLRQEWDRFLGTGATRKRRRPVTLTDNR